MSDLSPLRRKLGATRPSDKPAPLTPARMWRRAMVHGLARSIGLDVTVSDAKLSTLLPDKVADLASDGSLCALLDGPSGYGVAILDLQMVSAMIEQQTLGRVQKRAAEMREITSTDSAMVADPLDRVLAAQETLAKELSIAVPAGYRFATRVEEMRDITLSLADETHDHIRLGVSFLGVDRTATVDIILPRPALVPIANGARPDWSSRLEDRVLGSEVQLTAHLAQLRLTVSDVTSFEPGQILPLSRATLGSVQMIDMKGDVLAEGRLGQSAGRKAVRLGPRPEPSFAQKTLPSPAPTNAEGTG